ncbi:MAG: PAS domain S-box protein [Deltaproteobacteria bacterium]|nr:PAS domain S-box protein [Deltaproteobacteria bacterium]
MRSLSSYSPQQKSSLARLEPDFTALRHLVEQADAGFWLAAVEDGRVQGVYANPAFEEIWGRGLETLYDNPAAALAAVHPEDQERLAAKWEQFYQGRRFEEEFRVSRPDGRVRWVKLRSQGVAADQDNKAALLAGTLTDITSERRAAAAIKEGEARRAALLGCPVLGMALMSPEGQILESNRVFQELLGQGGEIEAELRRLAEKLQRCGDEFGQVEMRYLRRDGQTAWARLGITIIRDQQGTPLFAVNLVENITGHRRAEEALTLSRERFRLLYDKAPLGYQSLDEHGHCLDVNQTCLDLLGYAREEVIGRWFGHFLAPADKNRFEGIFAELKEKGEINDVELDLVRRDGTGLTVSLTGRIAFDEQGGYQQAYCMLADITARKQAEAAVAQSEQKYRVLVNTLPAVVFRGYADWTLDFFDNKIEELTGYSQEEFNSRRRRWCEVIVPEDLERVRQAFLQALRTTKSYSREYRIRDRDGKILWVHARGQVICTDDGRIDYISGVLFDITREKEMEQLLAAEKERLAVTLRSIGEGVIATDTDGNIVLMNGVAEELTGWTQPKALGLPASQVFALFHDQNGSRCEDLVERVIRTGEVVVLANGTHLAARDGTARNLSASGAPIVDKDGQIIGVVLVFRDITTRRRTEAEFLKMEKLSSLAILAGGIAHDFNNILTGILGNISLAMLSVPQEDEVIAPQLAEAERATLRARDLVQQLLTFAKGGAPVKELASLTEIIRESATFACRGSQVRAEFDLAPDLWPGEVDTGQISQVIQNLTINAVQAMPGGGIVEVLAANVNLSEKSGLPLTPGRYVKICVKDYGVGIPEDHLAKIFDPYFSTKRKGSGLGLATAYSIITNHDGYMTVESKPGEGTAFFVYLPASSRELKPKRQGAAEVVPGKGKILVMDDDASVREVAGRILAHLGYQPDYARDGEEAIAAFASALAGGEPFDAVIMDLTIPGGMGGKEAIQKLRQLNPETRAIVSSGYADDPIMTHYKKYGFSGVIKKPYRVNTFSKELRRVLARQ